MTADRIDLALFAAGAIGLIIARRATFAAEVAGCQVEIGAAGAMAAAAVVEAAGRHGPAGRRTRRPSPSRIRWARSAISSKGCAKSPATRGMPWRPPRPSSARTW